MSQEKGNKLLSRSHKDMPAIDRFWNMCEKAGDDDCWNWLGCLCKGGYGKIKVDGKTVRSNRFAYTYFTGEIQDGLCVRHKCDNPRCVNPRHLEVGTLRDNVADRDTRNRTACGESQWQSKASVDIVSAIRSDKRKLRELSIDYNMSVSNISAIRTGRTWKSVDAIAKPQKKQVIHKNKK